MRAFRLLLLLASLCVASGDNAIAQKQYNIWYFGVDGYGLDFNETSPALLTDGGLKFERGAAVICDKRNGSVLFYTNGWSIANREHRLMAGTQPLGFDSGSTLGTVIVPFPNDSDRYYVFVNFNKTPYVWGLWYSIVDMRGDSGRGEIVSRAKVLDSAVGMKLCVVRHRYGNGYWVITQHESLVRIGARRYYSILVNECGIVEPPVISDVGMPGTRNLLGIIKSSPDGTRLVVSDSRFRLTQLMRFDAATGALSDPVNLPFAVDPTINCAASFSPDNSKLYTYSSFASNEAPRNVESGLMQFDVSIHDSAAIARSRSTIRVNAPSGLLGSMQIGPNGKLYIANGGSIDIIDFPNLPGAACRYRSPGLSLPNVQFLPHLIDSYLLDDARESVAVTAESPACHGDSVSLRASGGSSYRWSPSNGLSCTDCAEPRALPERTTTYHVTIGLSGSCTTSDSVTVVVLPLPTADAGASRTVCRGDATVLSASGGIRYSWSPSTGLSCVDCQSPTVRVDSSTTYRVHVIDSNGCSAFDTVTVSIQAAPVADAGSSTSICAGDSTSLEAGLASSYRWSPANGLSCADCRSPIASPTSTTTYTLEVASASGCVAHDSVTIEVRQRPNLSVANDTIICLGDVVKLAATGKGTFEWTPRTGLSCWDCAEPVASPLVTTLYHVVARDPTSGCSSSDSVLVSVFSSATVDAGADAAVCADEATQLRASDGTSWRWSPQSGLSCSDCRDPVARPRETTTYTVHVTGPHGCAGSDSVTVFVNDPAPVHAGPDRSACAGAAVQLAANGAAHYQWTPTDGLSCSDCPAPVATVVRTTQYVVIGTDSNGCVSRDSVTVSVEGTRTVRGSLGVDQLVAIGDRFNLALQIDDAVTTADINELIVELEYPQERMRINGSNIDGGLLDGWSLRSEQSPPGIYRVRVNAQAGDQLLGSGLLMSFEGQAFLADSLRSNLMARVSLVDERCERIDVAPVVITLDSICGLSMRQIQLSVASLSLSAPAPNPVGHNSVVRFSIPFDDNILLTLIDARGTVSVLASGVHGAGDHAYALDVEQLSSGLYDLQLRVGGLMRRVAVVVVR